MAEKEPAADVGVLRARLASYMNRRRLRSTAQRRLIIDTFFEAPSHVTVDELYARVRGKDQKVGYATVYRALKLFTECGIAHERRFRDGPTCYEIGDSSGDDHHDHLICLECGEIVEFHDERIEALQEEIASKLGFAVESHRHEIYGACRRCKLRR